MNPLMNALMPGEHNYQQGKPMPGQMPMQQPQPMMQPEQSEIAKRGGFLGGVGNALGTVLKYGAPEAYEQGRQMKVKGQVGNALAEGNYESAAQTALKAGNIDEGLKYRTAGTEQQAVQRKQEAQGVLQLFTTLQPAQVTQYAMEDPAGFERMTGMSSDEYMQAGAKMQQMGIPPEKFAQMVISKAQAELGQAPKEDEYGMTLTQGVDAQGNPVYLQPNKRGGVRPVEGYQPPPEDMDAPGQATDALGVRRYTDGPQAGQVVPGFETPKPQSGGIRIDKDGNITIGGPAGNGAFGRYSDSGGAGAFNNALESASDADTALSLLNQARGIIDGGYNSGALAPIKGKVGAILNEFGAGNGEEVADYEQFTAVNNQLAAQMLKLFGGSDTEKELAISMASNIGPGFSEPTNKRMFEALEKTIAIQRQKPEYIAQWMKSHPSLDAVDPQSGLGFQATWDRYLQQQSSLYFSAANAAQPEMAGRASGGLPAGEIEALSDDDILSQLGLN